MPNILVDEELHTMLKTEAQRRKIPMNSVIGQTWIENRRLKQLAQNIQDIPVKGTLGVLSDISNEIIVLECTKRGNSGQARS
jgi:hypothetical protein